MAGEVPSGSDHGLNPNRRSLRASPPKRTCHNVTSSVVVAGQLDLSSIEIPALPFLDSQDSVFSFGPLVTSQHELSIPDGANVAMPSSQEETLAEQAQRALAISSQDNFDINANHPFSAAHSGEVQGQPAAATPTLVPEDPVLAEITTALTAITAEASGALASASSVARQPHYFKLHKLHFQHDG